MITVVDSSDVLKKTFEKVADIFFGKDAELILVNADTVSEIGDDVRNATCPVLFYGFPSELSLRRSGNFAAPLLYKRNCAYFQLPFELTEMVAMYEKIRAGKKIENPAVLMAAERDRKDKLVPMLLHDLYPGKYGCEKALATAKSEFRLTGVIEEVREKLEGLRRKGTRKVETSGSIIPGVFCDMDGTLFINSEPNRDVLQKLEEYAKTKPVSLWTGGDIKEAEKLLRKEKITYPLLSKYDFEGCRIEIAIDDYSQDQFEREYRITAEEYIRTERG